MKKLILLLIFTTILFAQNRILIDEDFTDWDGVANFYEDPVGDNSIGDFDFRNMWVTNDDDYLYIRIQTSEKINLVQDNYMTMFIDTDNNTGTGKSIDGIGAELQFTFGWRDGKVYLPDETNIEHDDIGFFGAPTFSGNDFEFVVKRNSEISGSALFSSNTIKIKMFGYSTSSLNDFYDKLPDTGGYEYTFQSGEVDPVPTYSINKTNVGYLRMMSYNVEQDGIIETEKTTEFSHIFKTINPEIIGIVESYDASAQQVADRIEFFLPSGDGENWYNKKEGAYDIVLVSRFQIKQSFTINSEVGHDASGAFLLDLRPKYESDMLVIVAHPKCCSGDENDEKRQNQFDAIMAFIRDAMSEGGDLTISPNIPIVIMGDMNLVGDVRQYNTMITGNIYYEGTYGEDFAPDWDGGNLDDSKPYATNTGMTYTTNPGSYPPGRLDFLIYSGSVMEAVNSYIFDSTTLTSEQLSEYGLDKNDTKVSDHLPVVVDFDLSPVVGVKKKDKVPTKFGLMQNYPNPFNPTTKIKFSVGVQHAEPLHTTLSVYNALGQKIKTLLNKQIQPGNYEVEFNGENLPSGIYLYKLTTDGFSQIKKMLLLK